MGNSIRDTDTQFLNDFKKLQAAAEKLEGVIANYDAERKELEALEKEVNAPIDSGSSESDLAQRMYLVEEFLGKNSAEQQGKNEVLNQEQVVRADFENCVNDISGNTTDTTSGQAGKQNLINTALDLDKLLSSLNGTQGDAKADAGIQDAIGGTSSAAFTNLDTIRKEIYLGNGDAFDPTIGDQAFVFAPNGCGKAPEGCVIYESFAAAWKAAQGTSGAATANQALKAISDGISTINQSYSSASAECNVETQQLYSSLQTILTVLASICKATISIEQAVNQKVSS